MSGRVHVTLSDGRRVIGYRKTLRRQSPRAPQIPNWRLSFELPPECLVSPGLARGFAGVTVYEHNHVEVVGKIKDSVISQAGAFVALVVPGTKRWAGRMVRGNEPGPTLSGPLRRGDTDVVEFLVGARVVLIAGTTMRTVVFAA